MEFVTYEEPINTFKGERNEVFSAKDCGVLEVSSTGSREPIVWFSGIFQVIY